MIELKRITTSDRAFYEYMEGLMIDSFPPDEYRSLEEQRAYTDAKSHFHANIVLCNNVPAGFVNYWDFEDFYYVEHFAIDPGQRNAGLGKCVLDCLCNRLTTPVVLEVEVPMEETAQRRIGFYRRNGFSLWERDYRQPPYKLGDDYLPMLLMARGAIRCEDSFETVRERIYREVYNVTFPWDVPRSEVME